MVINIGMFDRMTTINFFNEAYITPYIIYALSYHTLEITWKNYKNKIFWLFKTTNAIFYYYVICKSLNVLMYRSPVYFIR